MNAGEFKTGKPRLKQAGRRKGTPNKVSRDTRAYFQMLVDGELDSLREALQEVRFGIEIEKQMPDGQTVVGRLNADPKGYIESVVKLAKFCLPELARLEHTGENGKAILFKIEDG